MLLDNARAAARQSHLFILAKENHLNLEDDLFAKIAKKKKTKKEMAPSVEGCRSGSGEQLKER